jgi:L-ascorbate metabolism protein UlaG (beta-lactamase superfamily)
MELTYYGHSCFLLKTGDTGILFDPFISQNPLAKNIDLKSIQADYILLSHAHGDHLADAATLARQNNAKIVAQPEITDWYAKQDLTDSIQMNIGGTVKVGEATAKMVIAIHSSSLPDGTYGGHPAGYVVQAEGKTIYFAGDTALTYDMKIIGEQFAVDYALLPIGGHYTMDAADAMIAAHWVKARNVIAMHFDSFPPIKIEKETVSELAKKSGKDLNFMEIGQTITL